MRQDRALHGYIKHKKRLGPIPGQFLQVRDAQSMAYDQPVAVLNERDYQDLLRECNETRAEEDAAQDLFIAEKTRLEAEVTIQKGKAEEARKALDASRNDVVRVYERNENLKQEITALHNRILDFQRNRESQDIRIKELVERLHHQDRATWREYAKAAASAGVFEQWGKEETGADGPREDFAIPAIVSFANDMLAADKERWEGVSE